MPKSLDSFNCRRTLTVGGAEYIYFSLIEAEKNGLTGIAQLPYSMKVLLENLLRNEDGRSVTKESIQAIAGWLTDKGTAGVEIAYRPARVLMQDFTGVPAVVDLAAMRDAMASLGGDPQKINPLVPVDLVIDHSVIVDEFGTPLAFARNVELEYQRNEERYKFLKWGQQAFRNFRVVPPGTGICHQVNLEYLAQTVWTNTEDGEITAYPDTCVGTDSHTTMVNGLGVLGWGVGGIEAEAAMLGQPVSMLLPEVIGFRLTGKLKEGVTATDLVLTVTQMLRKKGVVGKFVEFFGSGLSNMTLADRATIGNMAPEYGATCGFFPVDGETIRYLTMSGRSESRIALVEEYAKAQGMWRDSGSADPVFTDLLELDLAEVVPSMAGPKRPEGTASAGIGRRRFRKGDGDGIQEDAGGDQALCRRRRFLRSRPWRRGDRRDHVMHQHLQPERADGRRAACPQRQPARPEAEALGQDLARARQPGGRRVSRQVGPAEGARPDRLQPGRLRLHHLHRQFRSAAGADFQDHQRQGADRRRGAVRQSQFRRPRVARRAGELPGLAAAGRRLCAGRVGHQGSDNRAARRRHGTAIRCSSRTSGRTAARSTSSSPRTSRANCSRANMPTSSRATSTGAASRRRKARPTPGTTIRPMCRTRPISPGMRRKPGDVSDIKGARVLGLFGDKITTDHISPAGSIKAASPAGKYLMDHGVGAADFNQYGTRRGNHEVMMRGTFANIRIRNHMLGENGREGGYTIHYPSKEELPIYDAAMRYKEEGMPLVIFAGVEYGNGSSRDWAAKGTNLLGVRAVIAQSFERIHRSNLVGMGVIPFVFEEGTSWRTLGLKGDETVTIDGLETIRPRQKMQARITYGDGTVKSVPVICRIDTVDELDYFKNGGILQYVLRDLAA